MAIMLPEMPKSFKAESLENVMFESLSRLSDDYYVLHSLSISTVTNNVFYESETDFVVFNPAKGILCIEAKAGNVKYKDGKWRYGSGKPMSHDGPYLQAAGNKWKLKKYIEKSMLKSLLPRCKMHSAVWFPSITKEQLNSINFPTEVEKSITLIKDDLEDPTLTIEKIFEIDIPNHVNSSLTEEEGRRLINSVFCPAFNLFPTAKTKNELKEFIFNRLLKEQVNILNYLVDQKTALINGAAGTGKTMIAIEKAKRNAESGDKVLFLCYNNMLKEFLSKNYQHDNVSYYTIDGLACKVLKSSLADYEKFEEILFGHLVRKDFPYDHIIIDEGQDFGKESIEESTIIETLKAIIDENDRGSFYIFYDKLQMVQSAKLPDYIVEADCKLTLYKNCRNTTKIAETSMSPLEKKKAIMADFSISGDNPEIHFVDDKTDLISYINNLKNRYFTDNITVLTCLTEDKSRVNTNQEGKIKINFKFTTCRKFKGLEADTIIMVDIDKSTFIEDSLLFYVGSSRAKSNLCIITSMNENDAIEILNLKFEIEFKRKNARKRLAAAMGAVAVIVEE